MSAYMYLPLDLKLMLTKALNRFLTEPSEYKLVHVNLFWGTYYGNLQNTITIFCSLIKYKGVRIATPADILEIIWFYEPVIIFA